MSAPDNFSFDLPDFCKNCKMFDVEVLESEYWTDGKLNTSYVVT